MRLIHGANARGMQIKRFAAAKRKGGGNAKRDRVVRDEWNGGESERERERA